MEYPKAVGLPEGLLYLWHSHRTGILLTTGILFACLRLAIHWHRRRSKVVLPTPLSSPVDEKPLAVVGEHPATVKETSVRIPKPPKRVTGVKKTKPTSHDAKNASPIESIQPLIFYFSLGGSTKIQAENLQQSLQTSSDDNIRPPSLHDLTSIELDDYFINPPTTQSNTALFYLLILPSYDISTELDRFTSHLQDTHHDFRIDTSPLRGLAGYSVFGFGDAQDWGPSEREGFCKDSVEVDKWMAKLTGGKRAFPMGAGDVRSNAEERLDEWRVGVQEVMQDLLQGKGLGEGVPGSGEPVESGDEAEDDLDEEDATSTPRARRKAVKRSRTDDLEDLKAPIPVDFTTNKAPSANPPEPKPMVPKTSPTYTSLTKQGYTIIGTHSGVKICRWTKSALRGRGSCYKHSFYGIASHLCMEATPSLSCSNKCVFCWRHGTNPVGTTWRWTVDPPELVFEGMKEGHYKKIKMLKGVPGVRAERFSEAMKIRHCALSLVGEPIFYPHINRLLDLLHKERISTFLVCNAQHPDHLAKLGKVTQLYVSIDASNKESLKRIDRPLHRDFWERFLRCMDILKQRRWEQRTVFRLTLVKDFNIEDEAEGYAELVERALPGFVEVKGVTYCGTSTSQGAGLSMRNVPFYEEVSSFVLALEAALKRRGLDYGIAAEHAHSCCILLADRTRFFKPKPRGSTSSSVLELEGEEAHGKWHTLIDYTKFFESLENGNMFGPEDYIGEPTPEWALWGNGGFDPRDERVDRKGRPAVGKVVENES